MKDISPILHALGLLDSEIKTYMAALENGPGTVLEITKHTRLSRQATYVAIESLTERGLMSSALRGKKRFYASEAATKLLSYAKRRDTEMHDRVQDLERMVPELELLMGGEKPVVKVFEGKEGLRAIIDDMEQTKSKYGLEISDSEAMYKVLQPEDLKGIREQSKKVGMHIRGLYAGELNPTTVQADRVMLPKELGEFRSNIGIYGDKIAFVTFEGKMHSVLIESPALTKAMRILFELAFTQAKEKFRGTKKP